MAGSNYHPVERRDSMDDALEDAKKQIMHLSNEKYVAPCTLNPSAVLVIVLRSLISILVFLFKSVQVLVLAV